jgi:hypothetical protein
MVRVLAYLLLHDIGARDSPSSEDDEDTGLLHELE